MYQSLKGISARQLPGAVAFAAMRGSALVRGFLLKQFLQLVWGAKVGKHLTCFGWPRVMILFGKTDIGDNVVIGRDVYLHCYQGAALSIGSSTSIGDFCTIGATESIQIGENGMVAEFVSIRDYDHGFQRSDIPMKSQGIKSEPIRLGDDVWIARGVAVLKGSWIGSGSIIGANAVVARKSFDSGSIAVGVPARKIAERAVHQSA